MTDGWLFSSTALTLSISTLAELAQLVSDTGEVYVRYSEGPAKDQDSSIDKESGLPPSWTVREPVAS